MAKYILHLPFLSLLLILVTTLAAHGTTYEESRNDASSRTSDIYNTYFSSAENLDTQSDEHPVLEIADYSELMERYEEASGRDPLNALLERYPIAERVLIDELAYGEIDDIALILNQQVDEELIFRILLARSPRLARAVNAWRASLNRYPQTIFIQDLLYRYQAFSEGISLGVGREYQRGMIQMNYASPGMLTLRGQVVDHDIEIAWNDYLREGSEVIADASSLLAEIRNKDDLIRVNSSSVSKLSLLRNVIEAQYIAGTRAFSDLVRIRTELASRRDTLERIRSMKDGLLSRLATMLDLPPGTAFGEFSWPDPIEIDIQSESLTDELQESRPELIQIALRIEKMDAMIEMAFLRADPDQTFGFTWFQGRDVQSLEGDMNSGEMSDMAGMDMSGDMDMDEMDMTSMSFMNQPMINYRNTNYAVDLVWAMEMIDNRDAMNSMLAAKTDMALGMLAMQAERYYRSAESERVSSGQIIPSSRAALDVIKVGYTANENNFNDLIMAELALLMADMDLVNYQMEKRQAIAEIERLVGHSVGVN